MNPRALLFATAGAGVLAVLFFLFRPPPQTAPAAASPALAAAPVPAPAAPVQAPQVRGFDLQVRKLRLASGPSVLSVQQGERIAIHIVSDQAEELHLHGYNLKLELEPNQAATLELTADRSGRFEYEMEKSGIELGALEVSPR